ncbi:hypothetical protein DFH07DRAFT_952050 [Mycena maculata]|uniref:Uncharacterized protein n=1 Tax=Mycena maculata TaxID=230809 RepID=A0AAD7NUK0_9AGAR|nr:hypothetical protein DFH07DRAFT_952050 [Mycena maculata]
MASPRIRPYALLERPPALCTAFPPVPASAPPPPHLRPASAAPRKRPADAQPASAPPLDHLSAPSKPSADALPASASLCTSASPPESAAPLRHLRSTGDERHPWKPHSRCLVENSALYAVVNPAPPPPTPPRPFPPPASTILLAGARHSDGTRSRCRACKRRANMAGTLSPARPRARTAQSLRTCTPPPPSRSSWPHLSPCTTSTPGTTKPRAPSSSSAPRHSGALPLFGALHATTCPCALHAAHHGIPPRAPSRRFALLVAAPTPFRCIRAVRPGAVAPFASLTPRTLQRPRAPPPPSHSSRPCPSPSTASALGLCAPGGAVARIDGTPPLLLPPLRAPCTFGCMLMEGGTVLFGGRCKLGVPQQGRGWRGEGVRAEPSR